LAQAAASGGTVAIYMPGASYGEISRKMIASGMASDTHCLVVSNACRENQELLWTDLRGLQSVSPPEPPTLLILGKVAQCYDESVALAVMSSPSVSLELTA
jgi:siroheme synthase